MQHAHCLTVYVLGDLDGGLIAKIMQLLCIDVRGGDAADAAEARSRERFNPTSSSAALRKAAYMVYYTQTPNVFILRAVSILAFINGYSIPLAS